MKKLCSLAIAVIMLATPMSMFSYAETTEDLKTFELKFDEFTEAEKASPGAIMETISSKLPVAARYSVRGGRGRIYHTGSDTNGEDNANVYKNGRISDGKILDGVNNNVFIEDDKLVLKRDFSHKESDAFDHRAFVMKFNEPIESGGLLIKFTFDFRSGFTNDGCYSTCFIRFGDDKEEPLTNFNLYGKKLYLQGLDDEWHGSYALLRTDFTTGIHEFELAVDLDARTARATVDGVSYPTKKLRRDGPFGSLQFDHLYYGDNNAVSLEYGISNLSVSQIKQPKIVSSNVINGETGRDLSTPQIHFNTPMNPKTTSNVSLYKKGEKVGDAAFTLSEDGLTLTLDTPLAYSTPYEIKIGDGFCTMDGLGITEQSISFHTGHKPAPVRYDGDFQLQDADEQPVGELTGGTTVKAVAHFTNTTDSGPEPVLLLAGVYGADGCMESICATSLSVAAGVTEKGELPITLPEDMTGKTLRVFAWSGYDHAQMIMSPIIR